MALPRVDQLHLTSAQLGSAMPSAQRKSPPTRRGFFDFARLAERAEIYAFWILPLLMQLVHTRIRFGAPFTSAFTACRFTFQRRFVTLCACEMLFPNCGPLPQTSHTCAISIAPNLSQISAQARTEFHRFSSLCGIHPAQTGDGRM